jgi:hypothetical protein
MFEFSNLFINKIILFLFHSPSISLWQNEGSTVEIFQSISFHYIVVKCLLFFPLLYYKYHKVSSKEMVIAMASFVQSLEILEVISVPQCYREKQLLSFHFI